MKKEGLVSLLLLHLLFLPLAALSLDGCASKRRPARHVTPVSITDGDGTALGSEIALTLDTDPTVVHEVVDFRIADEGIASGVLVPSQGLVLVAKKIGQTTADLRTADGVTRSVTIVVKATTFFGDIVLELRAGEVHALLGEDEEITEWNASPPGSAVVTPNANGKGFSVTASEAGESTLLLRSKSGAKIVHLMVRPADSPP